jgi:hypothetical protein
VRDEARRGSNMSDAGFEYGPPQTVRLEQGDAPKVDEFARRLGVSQSAAIRLLVRAGLNAIKADPGFLFGRVDETTGEELTPPDPEAFRHAMDRSVLTPELRARAEAAGLGGFLKAIGA